MEHDVKEGWCICGEYHRRGDASKKKPQKAAPKKVSKPKAAKPKPELKDEPTLEEMLPLDDEDDLKYPFGAPRIF
jgi:hypothetical protein